MVKNEMQLRMESMMAIEDAFDMPIYDLGDCLELLGIAYFTDYKQGKVRKVRVTLELDEDLIPTFKINTTVVEPDVLLKYCFKYEDVAEKVLKQCKK